MISSSEDLEERQLVNVYPNPANVGGTLFTSEPVSRIELMSLLGQLIRSSNASSIDLNELTAGTYLVRLTSNDGDLQMKKIIIR